MADFLKSGMPNKTLENKYKAHLNKSIKYYVYLLKPFV